MIIVSYPEIEGVVSKQKKSKNKIVLTTGVFDLLHEAHIEFLTHAVEYGDVLLVGVESDKRVKKLKGDHRPINNIQKRLKYLSNVELNGYVFKLPDNFSNVTVREALIARVSPDVFAVSSHSPNQGQKQQLVEKYGGKVEVVMEQDKSISTTQAIENIDLL